MNPNNDFFINLETDKGSYIKAKNGNIKLRRVVLDTDNYGELSFKSTDECAIWVQEVLGIKSNKESIVRYLKLLARGKVKKIYSEIFYCWIEGLKIY